MAVVRWQPRDLGRGRRSAYHNVMRTVMNYGTNTSLYTQLQLQQQAHNFTHRQVSDYKN